MLAGRDHSCAELSRKLQSKGFDEALVERIIRALSERDLLSDTRFAEAFLRGRVDKGHGPVKIRHQLRERGIDTAVIDGLFSDSDVDWHAQADRVRSKRFGGAPPGDYRERMRQARFLQYRGFESEQIRSALNSDE